MPLFLLMPAQRGRADSGQSVKPNGDTPIAYVLGPDDRVVVRVSDAPEIGSIPFRIDGLGYIRVPMAGQVHAGGLTVKDLESELTQRFKQYFQEPIITVTIEEYKSRPVSVLGAVTNPGVLQLEGRRRLLEVLSDAGGLKNEAGNAVKITRRKEWGPVPLPNVREDISGNFSVAEVSIKSLMEARDPTENILMQPYDVVSVPRADLIYIMGAVKRSGGFPLNEREHMTVLQALAMAEGIERTAAPGSAQIIRSEGGKAGRSEIRINVKEILTGKHPDQSLQANDILFIPYSAAKSAALRGVEAALQMGTGVVIWRR